MSPTSKFTSKELDEAEEQRIKNIVPKASSTKTDRSVEQKGWLNNALAKFNNFVTGKSELAHSTKMARVAKAEAYITSDGVATNESSVWAEYGGEALEAALDFRAKFCGTPIRIIDARFLVALAENGGRLVRRQDLPERAFLALETLKAMDAGSGGSLRLVCVSLPWLQPDHPDPHGTTLRLLGAVLKLYLREVSKHFSGATYGVFLDYMSLPQKDLNGECRTPAEASLFERGVSHVSDW